MTDINEANEILNDIMGRHVDVLVEADLEEYNDLIQRYSTEMILLGSSIKGIDISAMCGDDPLDGDNRAWVGAYGSINSDDRDLYFMVEKRPSKRVMKYIKEYFEKGIAYISGDYAALDMQFIQVRNGKVVWAEKGNHRQINNAIFNTFHYHSFNMCNKEGEFLDCPIQDEYYDEVGLKAISTIRSILTSFSRTRFRNFMKSALNYDTFEARLDGLDNILQSTGLFSVLIDEENGFGKNAKDIDILQSLVFSMIQLECILSAEEVPYSKNAVLGLENYTPLLKIVGKLPDAITETALAECDDMLSEIIINLRNMLIQDGPVVYFRGDENRYHLVKETEIQE